MDILTMNTCSCSRIRCQLQWTLSFSPQHDSSSPLMVTPPSAEAHWAVRVSARARRPPQLLFTCACFSHLWRSAHFIGWLYHPLCFRVTVPQNLEILFQIRVFCKKPSPFPVIGCCCLRRQAGVAFCRFHSGDLVSLAYAL